MLLFSTINDIRMYFSTPVLVKGWSEADKHNQWLKELIDRKRSESEGVTISNKGGWQSKDDLFNWGGESIAAFTEWIKSCVFHIHETYRASYEANDTGKSSIIHAKAKVSIENKLEIKGDGDSFLLKFVRIHLML